MLYGVDVTNSRFFRDKRVLAAVQFAAEAHSGQFRKTGEPYVSHCIETALIVEHNLPPRAEPDRCRTHARTHAASGRQSPIHNNACMRPADVV